MTRWEISAPLTINWTLSNRCSFDCPHCYSRGERGEELPLEQVLEGIRRLSEWGVLSVNFGGGEPLLYPHLCRVAQEAAGRGMRVTLNTNGFHLDRDLAFRLADAGITGVGVSIDSHLPGTHDSFRGVEGSHRRACEALEHLASAGIRRSISTVVCRINHHQLPQMLDFAERAGVERINLHNFKCVGNGAVSSADLDLSPGEWREVYSRVRAEANGRGIVVGFDDPIIASLGLPPGSPVVSGSVCGKLSLAVRADGGITPCGFIPHVIGNLLTDDLDLLWHGSPLLHALRYKTAKGKCSRCSHYDACLGGCSARSIALHGDPDAPDPHCWEEC